MSSDRHQLTGLTRYALLTAASFVAISTLLCLVYGARVDADFGLRLRAGILHDLVAELPIGRQGLVSSLWALPLPTLAALPFSIFTGPTSLFLAHLYGLALVLSFAAAPLASLLRRLRVRRSETVAVGLLCLPAAAGMGALWMDLAACVAVLVVAVHFDTHRNRTLASLSGTFYGIAALSHPLGMALAALRLGALVVTALARRDPACRAVSLVRGCQIAYAFLVYIFVCWMIMGDPLHSLARFSPLPAREPGSGAARDLALRLRGDYADFAPTVSGLWGYAIKGILAERAGHHFVDFHPARIPDWERRHILLVVPSRANPLHTLSDLDPRMTTRGEVLAGSLLLSETADWQFYLVARAE